MPTDADTSNKWLNALKGHECGQSNQLCIKHFDPNDLRKWGGRYVLVKGAVPNIRQSLVQPTDQPSTSSQLPNQVEEIEHVEHLIDAVTSGCENCQRLQSELDDLKQQVIVLKTMHEAEVLKLQQKIQAGLDNTKKHVQEKKSLKNSLVYHKSNEAKLKSIVAAIKETNLISDEAADDLNVIRNNRQILKMVEN